MEPNNIYLGFKHAMEKHAEEAKGIPDKSKKTSPPPIRRWEDDDENWEFALQRHIADQAGEHHDLRLARSQQGPGLSWALPKGIPNPGEKNLAIQQPDHDVKYFDFEGEIEDGYGSGDVKLEKRTKAEVLESDNDRVKFNLYDRQVPQEMLLTKMEDDDWLLINNTPTRKKEDIPSDKPDMRELKEDEEQEKIKELLSDNEHITEEKLDGSHGIIKLKPGENPRVYSYREAKNPTGLINHTWKVKDLKDVKVPEDMDETILRGELWGQKKGSEEPMGVNEIGGILNSKVRKSRKKQEELGKLRPAIFDVVKKGEQKVEDAPYGSKNKIIENIISRVPLLEKPRQGWSSSEKRSLYDRIKRGDDDRTKEGVLFKNKNEPTDVKRVKFNPEFDVVIDEILPAQEGTKYEGSHAGAISYRWPGDSVSVGNIGTGFSDKLRKAMWENPDEYEGKVIKVKAHEVYPKRNAPDGASRGALRMPAFKAFHPDKNADLPSVLE